MDFHFLTICIYIVNQIPRSSATGYLIIDIRKILVIELRKHYSFLLWQMSASSYKEKLVVYVGHIQRHNSHKMLYLLHHSG